MKDKEFDYHSLADFIINEAWDEIFNKEYGEYDVDELTDVLNGDIKRTWKNIKEENL